MNRRDALEEAVATKKPVHRTEGTLLGQEIYYWTEHLESFKSALRLKPDKTIQEIFGQLCNARDENIQKLYRAAENVMFEKRLSPL